MLPLYVGNPSLRGAHGLPQKNPIYFIRKAIGKEPEQNYDIVVLNTDDYTVDLIPDDITLAHTHPTGNPYDIESIEIDRIEDTQVEPYALRDGSSAGEPRTSQAIITMRGFVRGENFNDLQRKVSYLNYNFDPFNNYLEGSSVFDDTIAPSWQLFENVGFGVLAWYQPAHNSWRGTDLQNEVADPFDSEEFARLNRFVFARSMSKPIPLVTKFGDMSVPFVIQMLMIDPAVYEFIPPESWYTAGQTTPWFTDLSSFGLSIEPASGYGSPQVSNEVYITPSYPWHFNGPGFREVYTTAYTEV